jgi:hypothetical protein
VNGVPDRVARTLTDSHMDRLNRWLTAFGNLGVIAGLLFLGIEIHQNTDIARATAYRENVQDIAAWRTLLITDSAAAHGYLLYTDRGWNALDAADRGRISAMINNIMGSYENAFFARRYGVIGDEEWERLQYGACLHYLLARKNRVPLQYTTPRFRAYLQARCHPEGSTAGQAPGTGGVPPS